MSSDEPLDETSDNQIQFFAVSIIDEKIIQVEKFSR